MNDSLVLHITNGDGAANIIKESAVSGDVLPWRDPMHHGPFPYGYKLPELSRIRLAYLSGDTHGNQLIAENRLAEISQLSTPELSGFDERDALLASKRYEEIVLWFEHDLLDQLQLLQILDYYAAIGHSSTLSLICIDEFPGIDSFRGLGQLNEKQMTSLWPRRKTIDAAQLTAAAELWALFRANEPTALQTRLKKDAGVLPFVANALERHFQEFPWVNDGLSRTERQLLTLIRNGINQPHKLFLQNMAFESCLFIGDARTYSQLKQLCDEPESLLVCDQPDGFRSIYEADIDMDTFKSQRFELTESGKRVLDGDLNVASVRPYNFWLGGVHVHRAGSLWFWDDVTSSFNTSVNAE